MLGRYLPSWDWVRKYDRRDLPGDLTAGVVVAILLVPQAMAYAMLAGLPPIMGLYAAAFPIVAYALFGSSRHLSVGPFAVVSLVVAAECSAFATPGSPEYIRVALQLCLLVGAIKLALGLVRLGFLANFLSHAVISGFTSAAAILIGLSQLRHLLGIPLAPNPSVAGLLAETARRIGETHLPTLGIGLGGIAVLLVLKKLFRRFPGSIVIVVLGTLLVCLLRLDTRGVKVVGEVPRGLPGLSVPGMSLGEGVALFRAAIVVVFVSFVGSISVAKFVATRERYRLDANCELRALGLANIAAALFGGCPVAGSLSRTAVDYEAGGKTQLASLFASGLIILTLLVLTPLFYYLPNAVLAAIIMVAVVGMIDLKTPVQLFKVKQADGWCMVATFAGTLVLGVSAGIVLGVALSLALFMWRSSRPRIVELGYLPGKDVFRDVSRFPEAKTYPGTAIIRVDSRLYFANAEFVEDRIRELAVERPDLERIIVACSGVNDVDAVAIETFETLMTLCQAQGIEFVFAEMKGPVRDLVGRAGWQERYGTQNRYVSLKRALRDMGLMPPRGASAKGRGESSR